MIVAIDGPSGAGKSTVATEVARVLGFSCLDTGAMYRAIAWCALHEGISLDAEDVLGRIAQQHIISFGHDVGDPRPKRVFVDKTDVTNDIRTAQIDRSVSAVSAVPAVREALVDQQRRLGQTGDYVVEGRDIGTVVFPDASVKVFLTASPAERARRRVEQNTSRGVGSVDYDEVLADIIRRDEIDSARAASPLRPAPDAVLMDSTGRTITDVVAEICTMARERR